MAVLIDHRAERRLRVPHPGPRLLARHDIEPYVRLDHQVVRVPARTRPSGWLHRELEAVPSALQMAPRGPLAGPCNPLFEESPAKDVPIGVLWPQAKKIVSFAEELL